MPDRFEIPEIPDIDIDAILRAPSPRPKPRPSPTAKQSQDNTSTAPIDPEAESRKELNAVQQGFVARAKAEEARRTLATDSEYWVCLCFQTREQVEAFLVESGWGTKTDKYVDGRKVARELDIAIPADPQFSKVRKIDRSWSGLVDSGRVSTPVDRS